MTIVDVQKKFTGGQLALEKILNNMGFSTILEYQVGKYFIDVFVPECNIGFEYNSKYHISKTSDERRKKDIQERFQIPLMHLEAKTMKDKSRLKKMIMEFAEKSSTNQRRLD